MGQAYIPKPKTDLHITPDIVFHTIYENWGLKKDNLFDPCPIFPMSDGLEGSWKKFNFVNPPYSTLKYWVVKAFEEADKGFITIMLLPSKTDQQFFHWLLQSKDVDLFFFKGRLKFQNNPHAAGQPHFLCKIQTNN